MKFPVAFPLSVTLSTANVALGYGVAETLRQAQGLALLMGPALTAKPDSLAAADVIALGSAIGRTHDQSRQAGAEAFLDSTLYLLSEWEAELNLPVSTGVPTATRRQRLLARWRVLRGGAPLDITTALKALFTTPPALSIAENPVYLGPYASPLAVYLFAVVVPSAPPTFPYLTDPDFVAQIRATVDAMKPAYTSYNITNQAFFLCDDAASVTDLTVLGS